jgi:hypothetical protein
MALLTTVGREDAIDVLCAHHHAIRGLLVAVAADPSNGPHGPFDQLCGLIAAHEAAENLLLRPVTRTCVVGGEVIAEARVAEESAVRERLDELTELDGESGQFRAAFDDLARRVSEHMDSEERYEFPLVRAYRDDDALVALGTVLRRCDPYPNEPGHAPGLAGAVISPLASAMSRVRGAVTAARP